MEENLWWSKIYNAHHFIEEIVSCILDDNSAILALSKDTPWIDSLYDLIAQRIRLENSRRALDIINETVNDPGEYLLQNYCKKEKVAEYRPIRSYAHFLGECDDIVLNEKVLWVKVCGKRNLESWTSFIQEYNEQNRGEHSSCVFLLEISEDELSVKKQKGIKIFAYEVKEYDSYVYCTLLSAQAKCEEYIKPYLAQLLYHLGRKDVALCETLVENDIALLNDPLRVCSTIKVCPQEIKKRVWETQLGIAFPIIENFRNDFIKKYKQDIEKNLPISNPNGRIYHQAIEVECGTLYYMIHKNQLDVEETDEESMLLCKNARNTLAHLNIITYQDMCDLLYLQILKEENEEIYAF